MLAALINNAMRAMMADVAAWRDATSGIKSTTGSANAYVLSTGMGLSALAAGERLTAKVNFTNTGTATLAVDGQTATAIHLVSGSALAGGELTGIHDFAFDGTYWQVLNPTPVTGFPDPGSNGLVARTAANTLAARTLTAPAAGITVTNGDGVAGSPTLVLANDLAALEGLSSTGLAARTAADTWAQRSIAVSGTGIAVTNADGSAGNPTITITPSSVVTAADAQLTSNIPQNSQSAAYALVLTDGEKHIFHPAADTTARTWTIPANASVAFPIGTAVTFVNENGAGVVTIAITSDTLRWAGSGTTGSRSLAANGMATALKVTSTEWCISGTGLT